MQTAEIVIYMVIALIIGILTLTIITTWDYRSAIDALSGKSDDPTFEKIPRSQFAVKSAVFWKSCGLGAVPKSVSFYVEPDSALTTISLDDFFAQIRSIHYCSSIQSTDIAHNCGGEHDTVDFPAGGIPLPHVVRLECDTVARQLVITT